MRYKIKTLTFFINFQNLSRAKDQLEAIIIPLSEKYLGISIKKMVNLPEKLQTTIEREPDFMRIVETKDGNSIILHLEFQTSNDSEMVYRMAEYKALYQRKYRIPVWQFVIYLGRKRLKMENILPENERIIGFELKDISHYSYKSLIKSDIPEEIILAILGDFHQEAPEIVVEQIIQRLLSLRKSKLELQRYVRQLNMLSRLRKLETITLEKSIAMPIMYDIKKDDIYLKGRLEGEETEKKAMVRELLLLNKLSIEQIAKVARTNIDFVKKIQAELKKEQGFK